MKEHCPIKETKTTIRENIVLWGYNYTQQIQYHINDKKFWRIKDGIQLYF